MFFATIKDRSSEYEPLIDWSNFTSSFNPNNFNDHFSIHNFLHRPYIGGYISSSFNTSFWPLVFSLVQVIDYVLMRRISRVRDDDDGFYPHTRRTPFYFKSPILKSIMPLTQSSVSLLHYLFLYKKWATLIKRVY